jgi:catechol 2,3-dioxygenase-like lactoylglutathione lyase family enzyme
LKFGGQKINLRPHDASQAEWIAAETCLPGTQDLCFIVAVKVDDIVGQFHACGVRIEQGPVTRQGALGLMGSVYCRDPEGNLIEVSSYSP